MASNEQPTEIPGVTATEPGDEELFQARMPFVWAGEAVTMLAFAAAEGEIPQALKDGAAVILYGADAVVGSATADTPLGANQVAAAQFAETIVRNLMDLGYLQVDTGQDITR